MDVIPYKTFIPIYQSGENIIDSDSGRWKIFNSLIFMKTNTKATLIYFLSKDGTLNALDDDHAFKKNYSNDALSGLVREKNP